MISGLIFLLQEFRWYKGIYLKKGLDKKSDIFKEWIFKKTSRKGEFFIITQEIQLQAISELKFGRMSCMRKIKLVPYNKSVSSQFWADMWFEGNTNLESSYLNLCLV